MWPWVDFRRLHGTYHDVIDCLVTALEAKDPYTRGHSRRVADMSLDLARRVGLKGSALEVIHIATHIHDIGKIGVPDQVLHKQGPLFPHEWAAIQRHPEIGYNILHKCRHLEQMALVVLHHHERWDGKGYPSGLKGEAIPLGSRIIALCDAIDAMTSERPYRKALSWRECWDEVIAYKGVQFDAVLVEAAEQLWQVWEKRWPNASRSTKDAG